VRRIRRGPNSSVLAQNLKIRATAVIRKSTSCFARSLSSDRLKLRWIPAKQDPGVCGTGAFPIPDAHVVRVIECCDLATRNLKSRVVARHYRFARGVEHYCLANHNSGAAMFSELMLALIILTPCIAGLLMALLVSVLASDERVDSLASLKHLD
jgi:hypothetical protein